MFEKQSQTVAESGVAVQANGDVIFNGANPDEVRAIAADTFRSEFYQFLGHAGDIATARAQKVVEDFIQRIEKENPTALNQANQPDFRYALLSAQKAYARAGNDDLEKLLVELLVQRSKEDQRNLRQIVLGESLEVVPKLTDEQVNALVLSFALRRVTASGVRSLAGLLQHLDRMVIPLIDNVATSEASYSHMAYVGSGVVHITEAKLDAVLHEYYPCIAQGGIDPADAAVTELGPTGRSCLIPSEHVFGHVQVGCRNTEDLSLLCNQRGVGEEDKTRLQRIFTRPRVNAEQLRAKLVEARPQLAELYELWDKTRLKNFDPSTVGVAIAHSTLSQRIPGFPSLSMWI